MANDWLLMLPELVLLTGALIVPFIGFYTQARGVRPALTLVFLLAALATTVWLAFGTAPQYIDGYDTKNHTIYDVFEVNQFALFFKLVFLLVAILVALVSSEYTRSDREPAEYYTLLLISTLGMMVVASSRDLITLFVGLETSTLSTYALVAFRKAQGRVVESGTKYFVISSLSTSLTLYGISLVYAVGGTVDLYALAGLLADAPGNMALLLAAGFLLGGLGFKISTVPFHMWAPDVYEGSPDTISAFLAAGSKKMGFAALIKIFLIALFAVKAQWDVLVGAIAILTMTIGNLGALQQTSLKRLLAWSSIAQAGYILIALPVGTTYAVAGALLHILIHALMKGGAFVLVAVLAVRGVGEKIDDWRGVGRRFPLVGFAMVLIMLSMAGLPPLAGFVSKFILFSSAIDVGLGAGPEWLVWLAVAGILNSALSLYYYARVVRALYVEDVDAQTTPAVASRLTPGAVLVCALVIVGLIGFGVFPQPVVEFSQQAAASLWP